MYRKAVVAWAHLGRPARVLELVQAMTDQGLTMGAQLHSQVVHGLAEAGKHEVPQPPSHAPATCKHGCATIFPTWSTVMPSIGTKACHHAECSPIRTCLGLIVLRAAAEAKQSPGSSLRSPAASPAQVALQYLLKRVPPALNGNAHLYNSILVCSLAQGRPYRAQAVLTAMRARHVPWDPATWCLALNLQVAALSRP